jgi:hypothetical protein
MPKISDNIVQRVLDATNIVDVVGKFVKLEKKGARYVGLCPFHDDRHATNFVVYPRLRCYKCFACGAKGDAVKFLREKEGLSFADAVRWLGKEVHIDVDDRTVELDIKAYEPPPPLPTLYLPDKMVRLRETFYQKNAPRNNFVTWLNGLSWTIQQRNRIMNVLGDYHLGTSKWGDAIFWQIDDNQQVRDGKIMKYRADGHRDKADPYSISWVSSRLFRHGYYDEDAYEVRRCLFGLHLLNKYPNAEVHIVESEKTAIVCAIYFGDPERHVWMATAGKSNLTRAMLDPVIEAKRTIALHPDKDATDDWEKLRKGFLYRNCYLNNAVMTLQWKEEDGEKADMADVLVRVMDDARRDRCVKKLADVVPSIAPAAKMLIDKLDLEETNGTR